MENKVFGELRYNTGWEKEEDISFAGRKVKIIIHAKAYSDAELVTTEQEDVYGYFENQRSVIMEQIEEALRKDSGEDFAKRYIPSILVIKKDGKNALFFDDMKDIEEGLAVSFLPNIKVMTPDEFL